MYGGNDLRKKGILSKTLILRIMIPVLIVIGLVVVWFIKNTDSLSKGI